jgi:hypothetical protein
MKIYPLYRMIGSKLTWVKISTFLSSRISKSLQSVTKRHVYVAECMCNELSIKAMKFFRKSSTMNFNKKFMPRKQEFFFLKQN